MHGWNGGVTTASRAGAAGGKVEEIETGGSETGESVKKMNCEAFEEIVHEIAAERRMDAALRNEGFEHARTCERCGELLDEASELNAGVTALARADRGVEAPAWLETRVVAAFRAKHAPRGATDSRMKLWTWSAGAIGVAAMIFAAVAFTPSKEMEKGGATPAMSFAALGGNHHVATDPTDDAAGFIRLPFADDPSTQDYGIVVRLEVSRATLAWLGLPAPVSDQGDRITADILINESGLPEAIRLMP
jgi:hypothetical protein